MADVSQALPVQPTAPAVMSAVSGDPITATNQIGRQIVSNALAEANDPKTKKLQEHAEQSAEEAEKKGQEAIAKVEASGQDAEKALQPWDVDAETKKYSTPPIEQFGSAGVMFAMLASAFTHTPMVNALNGAAAAMKAIQKGDADAYERAHAAYKDNMELTLKRHELEVEDQKTIVDLVGKNAAQANAAAQAYAAKYDAPRVALLAAQGATDKMADVFFKQQELGATLRKNAMETMPLNFYDRMIADWHTANPGKTLDGPTMHFFWQQSQNTSMYMSPEGMASAVGRIKAGQSPRDAVAGYGKEVGEARMAAQFQAAHEVAMENHVSDEEGGVILFRREMESKAGQRSVQQLDSQIVAMKSATRQLDYNIKMAGKEMAKLGSIDLSPVLNAVARGEQYVTGRPELTSLIFYLSGIGAESGRIMSNGTMSAAHTPVAAMIEAKGWISQSMTPDMLLSPDGVGPAMEMEGSNRIRQLQRVREETLEEQTHQGAAGAPAAAAPAAAAPAAAAPKPLAAPKVGTIEDGYRFKGGDAHDPKNWEKVKR